MGVAVEVGVSVGSAVESSAVEELEVGSGWRVIGAESVEVELGMRMGRRDFVRDREGGELMGEEEEEGVFDVEGGS